MAYSQIQKMETKVCIKASAEKFHDVFCNRTHHVANILPQKIQSVELHKGEWGSEGSIISWNYLLDGKTNVAKQVLEDVDKENHKTSFKVIEGDLLSHYKSFKCTMQVTPQEKGSAVNWVLEYEKQNEQTPDPYTILELAIEMTKEIGAHLTQHTITK